jgi:hypothetical protein
MADKISKGFSLSGWKLGKWLKGNKEAAKIVVSAGFGLWIPADPALKVLAGAVLKLVLDTIDFYASEVKLE